MPRSIIESTCARGAQVVLGFAYDWRDTMTSLGHEDTAAVTLVELLRRMAAERPDEKVFSVLGGDVSLLPQGSVTPGAVTFGELDLTARAIAAALQKAGVAPGERAVLLFPTGVSLVPALFGCLYAGVVAVPAPLPGVEGRSPLAGPSQWLVSMIAACKPAIVLSGVGALPASRAAFVGVQGLEDVPWLVTEAVSPASAGGWSEVEIGPETPAMLPPGAGDTAVVTHGRLLGGPAALGLSRTTAGWLPALQDGGMLGGRPGLASAAPPAPPGKGRAGSSAA
ncbi:AMP-binding protein [Chondromyces apiculatus]|uniref:Pyoverdine chromophore synthetase PvdL n=1 Tax=Chondromyces apiculatus DSM 436 TaxID=1192034 RepID=A0A017TD13_9BACT|nr:AMP-binding protein [Chondromyces apiculatus]EYF07173.1 Pyoverdine chromophore precursor synthetase PvdL [Chondromyces apiculatus DSM 436]